MIEPKATDSEEIRIIKNYIKTANATIKAHQIYIKKLEQIIRHFVPEAIPYLKD